ncbi:hypothetical protein CDAR_611411 [Caerostris darwini]|uniref:Uncharacterized protein n=1 Tax=Caerostris darwini TaxID=1538125 RepID=A0AAV4UPU6_9ARAC|nr:hypothetical protein CDAR_611411 [Caerostris darwini]
MTAQSGRKPSLPMREDMKSSFLQLGDVIEMLGRPNNRILEPFRSTASYYVYYTFISACSILTRKHDDLHNPKEEDHYFLGEDVKSSFLQLRDAIEALLRCAFHPIIAYWSSFSIQYLSEVHHTCKILSTSDVKEEHRIKQ